MIAAEVMKRDPVTIREDRSVTEAAHLLLDEEVTGLPVVDRRGRLVGVISLVDLVEYATEKAETPGLSWPTYHRDLWFEKTRMGDRIRGLDETARVREVMSDRVYSVTQETPVEDVVHLMLDKDIHRVIVTREGEPVGIITSMDLVRLLPRLLKAARLFL